MRAVHQVALVVREYDEAIAFYTDVLGFELVEDTDLGGGKRWVRVRLGDAGGATLLLARATTDEQRARIGNQAGGRVFLFIATDDVEQDYARLSARGVQFTAPPRVESYGRVVVALDLYGNKLDLVEPPRDRDAKQR